MNDLISRSAALGGISAIKPERGDEGQIILRAECWMAVRRLPAVDAVPVKWLRNEAERQHDRGEWLGADVILQLIETWQKEQEGKNG